MLNQWLVLPPVRSQNGDKEHMTESPELTEVLDALQDVIDQACSSTEDFNIDSMAITSYANAMRLLAKYDRMEIEVDVFRRVIGKMKRKVNE